MLHYLHFAIIDLHLIPFFQDTVCLVLFLFQILCCLKYNFDVIHRLQVFISSPWNLIPFSNLSFFLFNVQLEYWGNATTLLHSLPNPHSCFTHFNCFLVSVQIVCNFSSHMYCSHYRQNFIVYIPVNIDKSYKCGLTHLLI